MKYTRAWEVKGFKANPPYERVLKVLLCPDLHKTKNFSLGMTVLPPGSSSSPHIHEKEEEVWYVVWGRGEAKVGDEKIPIERDVAIYVPPNTSHQLINTGDESLKVLWFFTPPGPEKNFWVGRLEKLDMY